MTNNYPENFNMDELMIHKKFSQLSEEEKKIVLELLGSESEYEDMRKVLIDIKQSLTEEEEIIPDESIKSSLLQQFKDKHTNTPKIIKLTSRKSILHKPVYQIAAVGLIVIGIGILLFNNGFFKNDELAENAKSKNLNKENDKPAQTHIPESISTKHATRAKSQDSTSANKDITLPFVVNTIKNEEKNNPGAINNDKSDDKTSANGMERLVNTIEDVSNEEQEQIKNNKYERSKQDDDLISNNDNKSALNKSAAPALVNKESLEETIIADKFARAENSTQKQNAKKTKAEFQKPGSSMPLSETPELLDFLFTAL